MTIDEQAAAYAWVKAHFARGMHIEVQPPTSNEVDAALEHLRERLGASMEAALIAEDMKRSDSRNNLLELIKALDRAGRLPWDQFVFMVAVQAEQLHSDYINSGVYDDELGPVNRRIREIEYDSGLEEDEFWLAREGPDEWNLLQEQWSTISDSRFDSVLRQLGFDELASLRLSDRAAYDFAREAGRRSFHHSGDQRNAVAALVGRYELEARQSVAAGAYYAALAMFGAACEARLLLAVLDHGIEATQAIALLPARDRPRGDPTSWRLDSLIRVAKSAGWFQIFEDQQTDFVVARWAHSLKEVRNLLHAERHALDFPHTSIGDREVQDARAFYTMISSALSMLAPPPPRPE